MNTSKRIALTSDPPNDCQARISKRKVKPNETWEAFKTLADVGVLIYAGVKRLEVLSRQNVQKNSD